MRESVCATCVCVCVCYVCVCYVYSGSTRRLHKRATHASRDTWAGQQGRPLCVTHATTERTAGRGRDTPSICSKAPTTLLRWLLAARSTPRRGIQIDTLPGLPSKSEPSYMHAQLTTANSWNEHQHWLQAHTVKLCILRCMAGSAQSPPHCYTVTHTAVCTTSTTQVFGSVHCSAHGVRRPQQQLYSHWHAAAVESRPLNA